MASKVTQTANVNERMLRFIDEYMLDFAAGKAAIRAGYAPVGAHVQAHHLLRNPKIAKIIEERKAERREKYAATVEKITNQLAYSAYGNVRDMVDENGYPIPLHKMPREVSASVREIEVDTVRARDGMIVTRTKVKLRDSHAPLKTLAQITGMLTQEGPVPASVVFIVERTGDKHSTQRIIDHDDG